jgi:hypothetical protein
LIALWLLGCVSVDVPSLCVEAEVIELPDLAGMADLEAVAVEQALFDGPLGVPVGVDPSLVVERGVLTAERGSLDFADRVELRLSDGLSEVRLLCFERGPEPVSAVSIELVPEPVDLTELLVGERLRVDLLLSVQPSRLEEEVTIASEVCVSGGVRASL